MKHLFYAGAFFLSALMLSCGNGGKSSEANDSLTKQAARAKYQAAVDSVEKLLHSGKSYDQRLATAAIKAYNDFAVTFPGDSMTAEYLFRAADLAQGAGNFQDNAGNHKQAITSYQQAAVYLETIIEKHKDYRQYRMAVFVAAYVYDTYLEDVNNGKDRARQLYQFVIDKYPGTDQAEQAKVLINYLGKPDSVLINDITRKGLK